MFDDLYPVAVTVGDRTHRKARAFHRDGQVRLYADGGTGVELVASGTVLDQQRRPGRHWTLTVDQDGDETTWDIRRASGCGCGSRLKRFTVEQAWA